jgi:hypothetical protein
MRHNFSSFFLLGADNLDAEMIAQWLFEFWDYLRSD